jgi:hypothetical protein
MTNLVRKSSDLHLRDGVIYISEWSKDLNKKYRIFMWPDEVDAERLFLTEEFKNFCLKGENYLYSEEFFIKNPGIGSFDDISLIDWNGDFDEVLEEYKRRLLILEII